MQIGIVAREFLVAALSRAVVMRAHTVAWVATQDSEALDQARKHRADLVLMDCPIFGGAPGLCAAIQALGTSVLVVAEAGQEHSPMVFEAMACGALAVAQVPELGPNGTLVGGQDLADRLGLAERLIKPRCCPSQKVPSVVALGASTGGPAALATILKEFTSDLDAVVIVVQHLDAEFSSHMLTWLQSQTQLRLMVAQQGQSPQVGNGYLALGDEHLTIAPDLTFRLTSEPKNYPFRPSVDLLFRALTAWPTMGIAALLTGVGRDGAAGLLELRRCGWRTLAQDQTTSMVYGMPKAAVELDAAEQSLPIATMGQHIVQLLRSHPVGTPRGSGKPRSVPPSKKP